MSETDIQRDIMVVATECGHRLMRNNVGKAKNLNRDGSVRYTAFGVGGKGSGDLIGWTQVRYVSGHGYGSSEVLVPVYTMVETKAEDGRHRREQERKIQGVLDARGIAGFCHSVADYLALLKKFGANHATRTQG
jgi:hypothetical protein